MKTKKRIESVVVTRSAVDDRLTAVQQSRTTKRKDSAAGPSDDLNAVENEQGTDLLALWRFAEDSARRLTAEDLAQIPHDGAKNYRHYLYGLPKRD
jgi:hypothetical protein